MHIIIILYIFFILQAISSFINIYFQLALEYSDVFLYTILRWYILWPTEFRMHKSATKCHHTQLKTNLAFTKSHQARKTNVHIASNPSLLRSNSHPHISPTIIASYYVAVYDHFSDLFAAVDQCQYMDVNTGSNNELLSI